MAVPSVSPSQTCRRILGPLTLVLEVKSWKKSFLLPLPSLQFAIPGSSTLVSRLLNNMVCNYWFRNPNSFGIWSYLHFRFRKQKLSIQMYLMGDFPNDHIFKNTLKALRNVDYHILFPSLTSYSYSILAQQNVHILHLADYYSDSWLNL